MKTKETKMKHIIAAGLAAAIMPLSCFAAGSKTGFPILLPVIHYVFTRLLASFHFSHPAAYFQISVSVPTSHNDSSRKDPASRSMFGNKALFPHTHRTNGWF